MCGVGRWEVWSVGCNFDIAEDVGFGGGDGGAWGEATAGGCRGGGGLGLRGDRRRNGQGRLRPSLASLLGGGRRLRLLPSCQDVRSRRRHRGRRRCGRHHRCGRISHRRCRYSLVSLLRADEYRSYPLLPLLLRHLLQAQHVLVVLHRRRFHHGRPRRRAIRAGLIWPGPLRSPDPHDVDVSDTARAAVLW